MERYEAYKDSGIGWVGQIPSHWEAGNIQRHAQLETGHTPSRLHPEWWVENECVIPWVTTRDVCRFRDGVITCIDDTVEHISQIGLDNSSARILPMGTVALSRTASVGFSIVLNRPMATSQSFADWVPDEQLDSFYLLYSLRSMDSEFEQLQRGSTHKTIYMPDIMKLSIAFPPLVEQREIVIFLNNALNEIDALVADCEREVELLREYRKAVVSEAVTKGLDSDAPMKDSGVEWIGEMPKYWETRKLKTVATPYGRIGFRGYRAEDIVNEGEGALTLSPSNLANDKLDLTRKVFLSWEKYYESPEIQVHESDVLLTKTGSSYGKSAYVSCLPTCATVNPQLLVFKKIRGVNKFFYYLTCAKWFVDQVECFVVGGTIPTIAQEKISNIVVVWPSLNEQVSIVGFLDAKTSEIDSLIEAKHSMAEKLREYRKSLISEAVTGKFKVPGVK